MTYTSKKRTKRKETKTEEVRFRVTPTELAQIDTEAIAANISRSDWARQRCFQVPLPHSTKTKNYIDTLAELTKQLAPIGNNINQIARTINTHVTSGNSIPEYVDNPESLHELNLLLNAIKDTAKGLIQEITPPTPRKRRQKSK